MIAGGVGRRPESRTVPLDEDTANHLIEEVVIRCSVELAGHHGEILENRHYEDPVVRRDRDSVVHRWEEVGIQMDDCLAAHRKDDQVVRPHDDDMTIDERKMEEVFVGKTKEKTTSDSTRKMTVDWREAIGTKRKNGRDHLLVTLQNRARRTQGSLQKSQRKKRRQHLR